MRVTITAVSTSTGEHCPDSMRALFGEHDVPSLHEPLQMMFAAAPRTDVIVSRASDDTYELWFYNDYNE